MSDAMLGFQNAAALEDVPVPFPYAQVVSFCLVLFAVSGNGSLGRQRIPGAATDPWGGSGSLGWVRIRSDPIPCTRTWDPATQLLEHEWMRHQSP